jgi:hypothetical protein
VRLTNSELLRAQYLKSKHQNATPNYLSYANDDLARNQIDGHLVKTEEVLQKRAASRQRLRQQIRSPR